MATGRHAKGKGRHRAPSPNPLSKLVLWLVVMTLLVAFAPVLLGIGLALGIFFGWMTRAVTRT
jgi:hypothetical protein